MHAPIGGAWGGELGRRHLLLLLMLFVGALRGAAWAEAGAAEAAMAARVDPRVELMSIIFRLAGNPEYNMPASRSPYAEAVEERFGPHRDDPVMKLAQELRRRRGVSYDAVMSMAVHIRDLDGWAEAVPFDRPPQRLDRRWQTDEARQFLSLAERFAETTDFAAFVEDHQPLYRQTAERLDAQLARHDYRRWFDGFFGSRPQAEFYVVAGLLNGGGCYGTGVVFPDGSEQIVPVIGCWKFDAQGVPVFDDSFTGTIAHELCHAYANPLVDRFAEQLQPAGRKIWPHRAERMKQQAYGTWRTMMYESMVRACVVRFIASESGAAAGAEAARAEAQRGFTWTEGLADLLAEYEADRQRYPSVADFMPRVVAFFEETAEKIERQAADAPKVVKITPADGDEQVDPAVTEIVIEFDRPMQAGSWSIVGGGPKFPKITGRISYDPPGKVLRVPVALQPDRAYELWLNSERFRGFRSRDGVPLEPMHVTFTTRADP